MKPTLTKHEHQQLERVAKANGLTAAELYKIVTNQIREELNAFGPGDKGTIFVFARPHIVDERYCENAPVPEPDAAVDLLTAWLQLKLDAGIASRLLEIYRSRALGQSVIANTLAWFKFWAVRGPTQDMRTKYQTEACILEASLSKEGESE